MTPSQLRTFSQVDVFGTTPMLGNPVAVVLEAEGLDDAAMQKLAVWTNLSETTFVLPATDPRADYRLRIFTPGGELPFAGHPTLGSAHAWLEHGGVPHTAGTVVQECAAGLVRVRQLSTGLSFAAPPTLRSGPLSPEFLAELTGALGVKPEMVLDHQWVDNGPGWSVLRLPTAADVLALEPDLGQIPTAMVGVIGAYPEGSEFAFEMRTFAPGVGVAEDPVCGSMNASVGQWLISTGAMTAGFRVSQGQRVQRAGSIVVDVDEGGSVWVGGSTTSLIRGRVLL